MDNPLCKLCGDNCSSTLSNQGYCIYCQEGYKKAINDVIEKIDELLPKYCEDGADEFAGQLKHEITALTGLSSEGKL